MYEEQIEVIKSLFATGYNIEWWDVIEGRYHKVLGFTQATGELAEGYDEVMNAQFIISQHPWSVVDFYDADPDDFYVVNRTNVFTMKLMEI